MEIGIAVTVIGLCASLSGILFAYLAYRRGERQDNKTDGKSEGFIMSDIGYIKSCVDRMEKNLASVDERYRNIAERLAKAEESLANAHNRINELADKEGG